MAQQMIPSEFFGKWQALLELPLREHRTILEVVDRPGEEPTGFLSFVQSPDMGSERMPFEQVRFENGELHARVHEHLNLHCVLAGDGSTLEGTIEFSRGSRPLVFQRRHPDFRRFELPRLTNEQERQREYTYTRPPQLDDGWETSTPAAEGIAPEAIHAMGESILNGAYEKQKSVLIVRNGRLCVEEHFYGSRREHVCMVQSVTKSVTSMVFGIAVDRGIVPGIDAPVHRFFPEHAQRKWIREQYPINVRHLLTMSAALEWNETSSYLDRTNDNTAMNRSGDWIGYTLDRNRAGMPGEAFSYTSGLSLLLGGILKNASGRYVDELAREYLFEPLGIDNWEWVTDDDGTRHTGGGLRIRPRDLAKLGQVMLDGGVWRGRRVLSESWIRESTSRYLTTVRPEGEFGYGYQWWLARHRVAGHTFETFTGRGYGGQRIEVIPELSLVVVLTADDYEGDRARTDTLIRNHVVPAVQRMSRTNV